MATAILDFLGQQRDIIKIRVKYKKKYWDWNCIPSSIPLGGMLEIEFATHPNDSRFYERITTIDYQLYKMGYPLDKGEIFFNDVNGDILKRWKFADTIIKSVTNVFYTDGENPMMTYITLSPAIQDYGFKHVKSWNISDTTPSPYKPPVVAEEKREFQIRIKQITDKKTFVPMGISAFSGTPENKFIEFEIQVSENNINNLSIEILQDNEVIYTEKENLSTYFKVGKHTFKWDGFNNQGIYDSSSFTKGKLKVQIKGTLNGKERIAESEEFSFEYKEVDWVDTKIDKNAKRIDITLRVNLKDGGARGLKCQNISGSIKEGMPAYTTCPWDNIPNSDITRYGKTPIKTRVKSFEGLKELVLDGINIYWSRRYTNTQGTIINNENWEIIVSAFNTEDSSVSLDDIPLIYNTNNPWSRSGNPGSSNFGDGNTMDELAKILPDGVVQRISYNVGYIKYSNGWFYQYPSDEDSEFKYTSAHEIGHEILQAYGGGVYSWQHKGSSYYLPQDKKPIGEESFKEEYINRDFMEETKGEVYPPLGEEVDLMKYYHNDLGVKDRIVAADKDVLGLMWLTKLSLK